MRFCEATHARSCSLYVLVIARLDVVADPGRPDRDDRLCPLAQPGPEASLDDARLSSRKVVEHLEVC